jgi:hypothetical protein
MGRRGSGVSVYFFAVSSAVIIELAFSLGGKRDSLDWVGFALDWIGIGLGMGEAALDAVVYVNIYAYRMHAGGFAL